MSSYWIGITASFVIGVMFGFFFCALLVIAKRADKQAMTIGKSKPSR